MAKLDKRLLVNISKTTAATALLAVVPGAVAYGIMWLIHRNNISMAGAMIGAVLSMYWLNFKKGRDFKQSFKAGANYFDSIADSIKHKSR